MKPWHNNEDSSGVSLAKFRVFNKPEGHLKNFFRKGTILSN
jgi:hypothetical protein